MIVSNARKSARLVAMILVLAVKPLLSSAEVVCPLSTLEPMERDALADAWYRSKMHLQALTDADTLRKNPAGLYHLQLNTANFLQALDHHRDPVLLKELAAIYGLAFDGLHRITNENLGERSIYRLSPNQTTNTSRLWGRISKIDPTTVREKLLTSTQFVYALARLARIGVEMDLESPSFDRFIDRTLRIAGREHLLRWIDGGKIDAQAFQRLGWGCGGEHYTHRVHIANLIERRYGKIPMKWGRAGPPHCNALMDTDLWIIAATAEIVAAAEQNGRVLSSTEIAALKTHAAEGAALLAQRHSRRHSYFAGGTLAIPDAGAFSHHRNTRYAGYTQVGLKCRHCRSKCLETCAAFPGWRKKGDLPALNPPAPVTDLGWDISHARRYIPVYDSLLRHRELINANFPVRTDLEELARQFRYRVWNGSLEEPSFANYFDGTDGWHRVNYQNRPAYGIAPGGYSDIVHSFGYRFWSEFEPILKKALGAAEARAPIPQSTKRQVLLELAAASERLPYRVAEGSCAHQ